IEHHARQLARRDPAQVLDAGGIPEPGSPRRPRLRYRRHAAYSARRPALCTSALDATDSSSSIFWKSAEEPPTGEVPSFSSLDLTSAPVRILPISVFSFAITSAGVPLGTSRPSQVR